MNEQSLLINEISNSIKYELSKRKIIKVEISARHVHLSQSDLEILFGSNYSLTPKRDLSQPGQYLSEERVKLVYKVKIEITDTKGILKPGIPADAFLEE